MRAVVVRLVALTAMVGALAVDGGAQGPSASTTDPRVGLKPGFRDAGVAARNMELVSSMPSRRDFSIQSRQLVRAARPILRRQPGLPHQAPPAPRAHHLHRR